MSISEEHFVGFDPTRGLEQFPGCPIIPDGAVMVWYERWTDTGWSKGDTSNTGIIFSHCYATFDALGNVVSDGPICGPPCCGFSGNTTCKGAEVCPDPDSWLARARKVVAACGLPPPGTIQICPKFEQYIGRKVA